MSNPPKTRVREPCRRFSLMAANRRPKTARKPTSKQERKKNKHTPVSALLHVCSPHSSFGVVRTVGQRDPSYKQFQQVCHVPLQHGWLIEWPIDRLVDCAWVRVCIRNGRSEQMEHQEDRHRPNRNRSAVLHDSPFLGFSFNFRWRNFNIAQKTENWTLGDSWRHSPFSIPVKTLE